MKVFATKDGTIHVELEADAPLSTRGAQILIRKLQHAVEDIENTTHWCKAGKHMQCENSLCVCSCHD